eukprot:TRINITY_DN10273_c0_g2_i1.p1 TRINITY_DN10273_c0_g2~~TRINITY_DN10273_c0_g2_i1.p1  ORF type:complete len:173 (+),score=20.09 TRINITY_DN10273_c0_g2_i1:60-521(+)
MTAPLHKYSYAILRLSVIQLIIAGFEFFSFFLGHGIFWVIAALIALFVSCCGFLSSVNPKRETAVVFSISLIVRFIGWIALVCIEWANQSVLVQTFGYYILIPQFFGMLWGIFFIIFAFFFTYRVFTDPPASSFAVEDLSSDDDEVSTEMQEL